jgi:hypothetical protein
MMPAQRRCVPKRAMSARNFVSRVDRRVRVTSFLRDASRMNVAPAPSVRALGVIVTAL